MSLFIAEHLRQLEGMTLSHGSHASFEKGHCAMEVVAWLNGEEHSDAPACVCPTLRKFVLAWNDGLPSDADRNRLLLPLLAGMGGTAGDGNEIRRAWICVDWLARVHAPAFLRLAPGLVEHAELLESLAPIVDKESLRAAEPKLAAARDAARAAAWAAAGDAAWDAARAAAWAAAWAAARAAARDAARAAAWAAAGAAARAAARAAAWAAAGKNSQPVVETLQASAAELVRAMCALGQEGEES